MKVERMAETGQKLANGLTRIDFATDPSRYRHWKLSVDGKVATLVLDVDERGGLFEGYDLKLNSYDLGVDIELADAFERIRFEHPEVRVVQLRSGKPRVFCAGANIRMLAGASHTHKVNFCKFTNETRNAIEDASAASGLRTICVINGTAAGGGYELALATDHIILVDDGSSSVSLPEVPLLAVLPGTGGLTRITDKRKVRRDRADFFCTTEEGIKGRRAVEWRLVDEVTPNSQLEAVIAARSREFIDGASQPEDGSGPGAHGISLPPLERNISSDHREYDYVSVAFNRAARIATITLRGPDMPCPESAEEMVSQGASLWSLQIAREIRLKWKRVLKRIDLTSRSLVALVEPGSCFAGTLAEIVFAADRSYMLIGRREGDNRSAAAIGLSPCNFGAYPMPNALTRLQSRFLADPTMIEKARGVIGERIDAEKAE